MRSKKLQSARPGSRIRFRPVAVPAASVKTMRRVFVKEKLMGFAEPRELGVELAHFIGPRVSVELAEMPLDRARHRLQVSQEPDDRPIAGEFRHRRNRQQL